MEKNKIKVYLDTCVLSRLLQNNISDEQLSALGDVSQVANVELVTSLKMLREFTNTQDERTRNALKILYKIIAKVPFKAFMKTLLSAPGQVGFNQAQLNALYRTEDVTFSELKKRFDQDDAEHIFQAVESECEYFLTLDYNSILNPAEEHSSDLKAICKGLKFVDPEKLLADLET